MIVTGQTCVYRRLVRALSIGCGLFPGLSREQVARLLEAEGPEHDSDPEQDVPSSDNRVLGDGEGGDLLARGVRAQDDDIQSLRLTDPARRDRKELGEEVLGRDQQDREDGDRESRTPP